DLAGDRRVTQRDEDQILLGMLDRLADRLRNLVGLAEPDAHVPASVADDDERREGKAPAALDDLRDAVDGDHSVVELEDAGIDARLGHSPLLKDQAAGPRGLGQCLDPSVILKAAAVEDHALHAPLLRLLRDQLAHDLRRGDVSAALLSRAERGAAAVHRGQRPPALVVDQLGVDVIQAAKHRQARARRGAADPPAQPEMPYVPRRASFASDHFAPAPAFLPTLRRTTSSAYLIPLPLYGSGLRNIRSVAAVCPSSALSAPRSVISVCLSISAVMPSGSGKITGCE